MEAVLFSASQKQEIKYVNEQKDGIPSASLSSEIGRQACRSSNIKTIPRYRHVHMSRKKHIHANLIDGMSELCMLTGARPAGGDHLLNLPKSRNVAQKTTQVNENTDSFAII